MRKSIVPFIISVIFISYSKPAFSQYHFNLNDLVYLSTHNVKKFEAFVIKRGYSIFKPLEEIEGNKYREYFCDSVNPDGLTRNKIAWVKERKNASVSFKTSNKDYRKNFETLYLTKDNGWEIDKNITTEIRKDGGQPNGYYTNGKFGITIFSISYGGFFWNEIRFYLI